MKTKIVIDNKVYNLETSKLLYTGTIEAKRIYFNFLNSEGLFPFTGKLYKTKKGNYFMINKNDAIKVDEELIKEHFREKDYEKYVELFGELEEA